MVKDLFEEGERWVLQPKPANLWWSSAYAQDVREDITFETTKGQYKVFSERSFQFLVCFSSTQLAHRIEVGWNKECRKPTGPVPRRANAQEQRHADAWWIKSTACSSLCAKAGRGVSKHWTESKDGKHTYRAEETFQERTMKRVSSIVHEPNKVGKDQPSRSEVIAERMWRSMRWVCATPRNAIVDTLHRIFAWRSTCVGGEV